MATNLVLTKLEESDINAIHAVSGENDCGRSIITTWSESRGKWSIEASSAIPVSEAARRLAKKRPEPLHAVANRAAKNGIEGRKADRAMRRAECK